MNSATATVDRLQKLRRCLDEYGSTADSRRQSWDELLDEYDVSLETIAEAHGIEVPTAPAAIQRRFSRAQRMELERGLTSAGVRLHSTDV